MVDSTNSYGSREPPVYYSIAIHLDNLSGQIIEVDNLSRWLIEVKNSSGRIIEVDKYTGGQFITL